MTEQAWWKNILRMHGIKCITVTLQDTTRPVDRDVIGAAAVQRQGAVDDTLSVWLSDVVKWLSIRVTFASVHLSFFSCPPLCILVCIFVSCIFVYLYRTIIDSWTSLCHPSIQTGWTGWRTSDWIWKWGDRRCGEQYYWLIGLWGRKVYVPKCQQTQCAVFPCIGSQSVCYLLFVQSVVPCIRSFPLYSNVPHCIPS